MIPIQKKSNVIMFVNSNIKNSLISLIKMLFTLYSQNVLFIFLSPQKFLDNL